MSALAVVYGSPTPPGKLARALDVIEAHLAGNESWTTQRIAPTAGDTWLAASWGEADVAAVADADAVVLSTPVFRASMSSTLKMLLDQLPVEALRSKPVGVCSVAAAAEHALGAEQHVRDVLAWFGALTVPNAAFFVDRILASENIEAGVVTELGEFVDQVTTLAESLNGFQFGPAPLAARK